VSGETWYHADFCHAYAWVYEHGDHLRVKWGERDNENLYLHARHDCARCAELANRKNLARYGEFTMPKPSSEFSSTEAFLTVLVEISKYVPGLNDDGGGDDSRSSSRVAPDAAAAPAGEDTAVSRLCIWRLPGRYRVGAS
jgi:hypothetical protein